VDNWPFLGLFGFSFFVPRFLGERYVGTFRTKGQIPAIARSAASGRLTAYNIHLDEPLVLALIPTTSFQAVGRDLLRCHFDSAVAPLSGNDEEHSLFYAFAVFPDSKFFYHLLMGLTMALFEISWNVRLSLARMWEWLASPGRKAAIVQQ